MVEVTWEIVAVLIAFFAMALGYITWFETKRDKRAEERAMKATKERENLKEEIRKGLCDDLRSCVEKELRDYVKIGDANSDHERILKTLGALEQRYETALKSFERTLGTIDMELKEAIQSRIQGEIIHFAESVKGGHKPSSIAYEHIYDSYKQYKILGGNGFIDDMFVYIKKNRDKQDDNDEKSFK